MVRELQAQSDVLMGQARSEFEKVQHELDDFRAQAQSAERERDTSMSQLAAEKIRSTQLQTYSSQLLYEKDQITTQFLDLTRHAAISGACQDIHWSANREPEGFSTYFDQVSPPPGLHNAADDTERAPQTPERRPQHTSSSPAFGLLAMDGSRGSGSNGKGAGSTPDRVHGAPHSLSNRSDRNPLMVRDSNRTKRTGRGRDGGNGDDDDDDDFMNDGHDGCRGNQPLGPWNAENDAWARSRPRSLAVSAASPGGGDDPGRDPSSILAKFDLF
eukprot:1470868-Amphidinium_carterae.1